MVRVGAAMASTTMAVTLLGVGAAQAGESRSPGPGDSPHEDLQWTPVSKAEVARHVDRDATDSSHPLASAGRAQSVDFVFGDETYSVDPTTQFEVYKAVDNDGQTVWDVGVITGEKPSLASSGFAVPPDSAWKFFKDGSGTATVDTWKRSWWYNINKADNYTASGLTRDYYRIYGRLSAAVLTAEVDGNFSGFDQAYLEFDRTTGTWPTSTAKTEFEPPQPIESVEGKAGQTITVGFKSGLSITLGKPPLQISGSYESTYSGSVSTAVEEWHPIQRSEVGSGGVMWCYYKVNIDDDPVEFNGTKSITARSSIHIGSTLSPGTWTIYTGQRDRAHGASTCPGH